MAPFRLYLLTLRTKSESSVNYFIEIIFRLEMHDMTLLPSLHLNLSAQSKEGHFSKALESFISFCKDVSIR